MGKYFHDENLGVDPQDPMYNDDFDADEEYERFLEALEEKEERDRGN